VGAGTRTDRTYLAKSPASTRTDRLLTNRCRQFSTISLIDIPRLPRLSICGSNIHRFGKQRKRNLQNVILGGGLVGMGNPRSSLFSLCGESLDFHYRFADYFDHLRHDGVSERFKSVHDGDTPSFFLHELTQPLIIINLLLSQMRESTNVKSFWIPAFAGMTF
jgi:hypothetical protein